MRLLAIAFGLGFSLLAHAELKVDFAFKNGDISAMIQRYAELSKTKFIVDPVVRGKADILVPEKVTLEEAYNLLSSALALNGVAISIQDGTYVVKTARNIQRDLIPVSTELPAPKPERMVSYIYTTKHVSAQDLNMSLRILASKDGEIIPIGNNKIMFTDWTSSIHRIHRTLAILDTADYKAAPPRPRALGPKPGKRRVAPEGESTEAQ